jgi:hypothetical protein
MQIRFLGFPILVLVFVCGAQIASAQPALPRAEAAVHVAVLRLSDFGATNAGIGGRVAFELTRWASFEAEGTFFPSDDIALPASAVADIRVAHHRRRAEAFAGVKLGVRSDRFGVFAKLRPGLTRLIDKGQECLGADCVRVLMLLAVPVYRAEFALDLGGIVEFYPTGRTLARVEVGDTMIRHRSVAPPCPADTCTSHNVSTRFGVGVRF